MKMRHGNRRDRPEYARPTRTTLPSEETNGIALAQHPTNDWLPIKSACAPY